MCWWQRNFLAPCSNLSIGFEPRSHVGFTSKKSVGLKDSFAHAAKGEELGGWMEEYSVVRVVAQKHTL